MALDPQAADVIRAIEQSGARPIETLDPEQARQQPTPADAVASVLAERGEDPTPEAVGRVVDHMIAGAAGGIPARIYWPGGDERFPVLVYFHGGGFVIGDLDSYDATPRALANAAGCIVVSVGYRRAPEFPFPAAHDDAVAAYRWTLENAETLHGHPDRVAIAGESAGANLAIGVALDARDRGLPAPVHQLLVYPVAEYAFDKPSYAEHAHARPLSAAMMPWFLAHYVSDGNLRDDPRLSPLRADLSGLPDTTVITAEFDPLRDDGRELALALDRAGIEVIAQHYDGVMHEFFGMGTVLDAAREATSIAATRLRQAFGTEEPSLPLTAGMDVVSLDQELLGQVKAIRKGDFLLDRKGLRRDIYVPYGAASRVREGRVELKHTADDFDAIELPSPPLVV
jgi:acetyl esterase/lipase